jgi:sulfoxide reductase heme-binding subunit YedZ
MRPNRPVSFIESASAKPAIPAAVILLRFAIVLLVVITMNEALETIGGIIYDIKHKNQVILFGALMAALAPSGWVFFWGYKAILMQLKKPIKGHLPIFPQLSSKKSPCEETLDPNGNPHLTPQIVGNGYPMNPETPSLRASLPWWIERGWRMARESGAGLWMGAAFCVALALTIIALAVFGTGATGMGQALRLTGRWSLLLFLPAYAGGAMVTLFGPRLGSLARHGREFGLAYAAAQLVHFGLVAGLIANSDRPILQSIMPFFAVGVVWTYLLALSSVRPLSSVFAPQRWRILRAVGLEYLALVFLADFVLAPIGAHNEHPLEYLPFSILIIIGPLLRVAAAVRNLGFVRK